MAAASLLERSGEPSLAVCFSSIGVTLAGAFSAGEALSVADGLSVAGAFATGEDFSVVAAFALVEVFSVVDGFAFVAGFPLVEVFAFGGMLPFVEAVPFDVGEAVPLVGAFSARSFPADAEAVAESATDLGAVAGLTAGAHALAMTITISETRA